MKFAIFVLFAGLCVAIASANGGALEQTEEIEDMDYDLLAQLYANELVEPENYGAFSGIYWVLKAALRTVKGIHCFIKFVVEGVLGGIKQFLSDVKSCGGDVSTQVKTLVTQCQKIASTGNNMIHMNSQVCNNDVTTPNHPVTGWNCFWRMLGQGMTLQLEIFKALHMITKVPKVGSASAICTSRAAIKIGKVFTNFPTYIKNCTKLTTN